MKRQANRAAGARGMTLMEVLIAMFIFLVGIVGVLSAIPAGVATAENVILMDCSIHLAHSKFSEFRRDRVNPAVDLLDSSGYMTTKQVPTATKPDGTAHPDTTEADVATRGMWRDFAYRNATDTYAYFDEIQRYDWRVDQAILTGQIPGKGQANNGVNTPCPAGFYHPVAGGQDIGLRSVQITVRLKGSARMFQFTQYMFAYDAP
jgi:prepilin-type N-terminal cleavage/methylation domain-containing protein